MYSVEYHTEYLIGIPKKETCHIHILQEEFWYFIRGSDNVSWVCKIYTYYS